MSYAMTLHMTLKLNLHLPLHPIQNLSLQFFLLQMISQQDDDRTQDQSDAAEMGRQLAAACKLIEKLKNQLIALSEEAQQLRAKEASLVVHIAALEEQGGKAARTVIPVATSASVAETGAGRATAVASTAPQVDGTGREAAAAAADAHHKVLEISNL
jgi:septal ring factor EnvC (AmiA/AmiB activator)